MSSPCLYSALFARFLPHTPVRHWLLGTPQSQPGTAAAPALLDRSVAFVCDFPIPHGLRRLAASFALGELMIPVRVYGNFVLGYILDAESVHKTLALLTGRKAVADNPVVARRCVVDVGSGADPLSLLDFCVFKDRSLLVTAKQFPPAESHLPVHAVLVRYPCFNNLDNHDLVIEFIEKRHTLTSLPTPQPHRALLIARRAARYTKYSQVDLPVSFASTQIALPVLLRVLTTATTVRVKGSLVIKIMAHDSRFGPIGAPSVRDLQGDFHIATDSQMTALRQVASLTASFNQPHNTASTILNHPLANHHNAPDDAHAADILAQLSALEPVQHKSSLVPHTHYPQLSYATTQPISSTSSVQPVYSSTTTSAQPTYSTNTSPNLPYSHSTVPVTVDATKPANIVYTFDYSPVSAATSTSPPLVPELPQLGVPPIAPPSAVSQPLLPPAPTPTQLGVTSVPPPAPAPAPPPVPNPQHPNVSLPLNVGVSFSLPAPSALHAPLGVTASAGGGGAVPAPALGSERGIFDKFFPAATVSATAPINMAPPKRSRGGALGGAGGKGVCSECGKCFFKSGALQRHMQKAHAGAARIPTATLGVERLECPKCDKTFSQQGSLNRHLRSIHEARKLHCKYCSLSFGQAFDLKRHQRRKHPNDALFVPREALPAMVRHNRRVVRQPGI